MNELDLFVAAIALAGPEERAALLERECAGQPELRQRLEQLVAAHFQPNAFLDQRQEEHTRTFSLPGSATASARIASEVEGAVIAGRYKLLQQIGEGAWALSGWPNRSNRFRLSRERKARTPAVHPLTRRRLSLAPASQPLHSCCHSRALPQDERKPVPTPRAGSSPAQASPARSTPAAGSPSP